MIRPSRFLVLFLSLLQWTSSFIFGGTNDHDFCYQLDLENCFREAFLAVMQPPDRRVRDVPFFHNANVSVLDKRKNGLRHLMLCHDVRRFSVCFAFPGCSDQVAAHVASVQYHMVFGKKLPIQVFLSYRGYGKQICEQSCSSEVMHSCRRTMNAHELADEEQLMQEATSISQTISGGDAATQCGRFRSALLQVMRFRSQYCGEAAKCTCMDTSIQAGLTFCNAGCEHLLHTGSTGHTRLSLVYILIVFVLLNM